MRGRPIQLGSPVSLKENKPSRIFDIPGLLSPCFTGRKSYLDLLRNIVYSPLRAQAPNENRTSYRRAAIYGLPGVGKTQLALKYASEHRTDYSAIFFVSASTEVTLRQGYERIVALLDLPENLRADSDVNVKVAAARSWLENSRSRDGRGWLLIVDNVHPEKLKAEDVNSDGPARLDEQRATVDRINADFLPREGLTPQGTIIFTTRNLEAAERLVGCTANLCLEVGEMKPTEAVQLLLRVSGQSNDASDGLAERVANELGNLPLAIDQAASCMKKFGVDLEALLGYLRTEEKSDVLKEGRDDSPGGNASIAGIYDLAFKELASKSPVSADLFRLFSFMNPEEIPLELLTDGCQGTSDETELVRTIHSPFQLAKALAEIRSGSLVQRRDNRKEVNFWIHDLVQYLYRQWQKPEERATWAKRAIEVVNHAYPGTLGSLETWQKAKKYLKHGLACMEHAAVLGFQTLDLADLMVRMSWYMRQIGDLAMAEKLAIRGVTGAEILGEGKQEHLSSISNLGLVYYHQSRFNEAREQWNKALEMGKKLLGPNYVETGIGNQLALLDYQNGRFDEAEKLHREIYERRMLILKEQHPETLGAMGSLANTYHFQGRMEDAVDMKIRVLEGRRKHMGENHPETLGAMGSLATTFSDQGHLVEAEDLQINVMKGRKAQWGEENPEFLSAKGALSYTFYLQKRLGEAESYQQQILATRTKLFGDQHIETLGAMRHLGKTYYAQKRLEEAAELQQHSKIGMGELLGETHPGTLSCMEELSITYRELGLLQTAKALLEKVTQEREKLWGKNYADTIGAMEALSRKEQGFAH